MQCAAQQAVLTVSTKSRLEVLHSWGAWWLFKMMAGAFCVYWPTKPRIWTKRLELEHIYPFLPVLPPFSFPRILNTPPASSTLSTSRDLHKTTPLIPKHLLSPIPLCMFPLGLVLLHATLLKCYSLGSRFSHNWQRKHQWAAVKEWERQLLRQKI